MQHEPIAATITALMPAAQAELAELVAFRSVADLAVSPRAESEKAAQWIARTLRAEDFQDVAILDMPDGWQSVYGYLPGPQNAPTVLLYAHFDVQPPLENAWTTAPFTLTERDGRWYGRGAADCKGAVLMHLLALRALKAHVSVRRTDPIRGGCRPATGTRPQARSRVAGTASASFGGTSRDLNLADSMATGPYTHRAAHLETARRSWVPRSRESVSPELHPVAATSLALHGGKDRRNV